MTLSHDILKDEFRLCHDGDPWGTAMHWHFTVADELHFRTGKTPAHWEYRPSIFGPANDPDDYCTRLVTDTGTDTLIQFGNLLARYLRLLVHFNLNY